MKQKTKTKEASRVKKSPENMVRGFCQRACCMEWASYHVFDQNMNNVGGYCTQDSEHIVRTFNRVKPILPLSPKDVQMMFPPL